MVRIGSVTINCEYVRAPVNLVYVTEDDERQLAKFKFAGFVMPNRMKFKRVTLEDLPEDSEAKEAGY